MNEPITDPLVARAVQGNASAIEFLHDIARVLHVWDDLVDKDKQLTDEDIHEAFWLTLIAIPNNAFYATHRSVLQPILVNAIVNWRIANNIERMESPDAGALMIAFITRSSYVDLATMSATLIGGVEWGVEQGGKLREWVHDEGFVGYLDNLRTETATREGVRDGVRSLWR